jgi:hypothetical protein
MKSKWWITIPLLFAPFALRAEKDPLPDQAGIPRIVVLPAQRVLAVAAQGDPDVVAGPAFKKLFRTFYAHADKVEKRHVGAPLARWALEQLDSTKMAWQGTYALPISEKFPAVPAGEIHEETWQYGQTAELLHIGTYDDEGADIAALKAFIVRNGFAISGSHEEVYLRGPGMLFKGNPRKYRTLIRYPVVRVGEAQVPIAKSKDGGTH